MKVEAGVSTDLKQAPIDAQRAEALGYDGVITPETGRDPFFPLLIAGEHTERITLGTAVAIAFPRSPMVTAQIAWDLQKYTNGRFNLGLGTQVVRGGPAVAGPRVDEQQSAHGTSIATSTERSLA